jgi:membrane protein required for colicin V production
MQGADYVIIALLVFSTLVGVFRGFVREIVALVTWLVAIWVAWRFSGFLHPYLGGVLQSPEQKAWVARGIMLLLVLLLGALVGAILSWMTNTAAGLSVFDRFFGFLFGVVRGAVVVGFAVLLGQSLRLQHEPWWTRSRLMPYAEQMAAGLGHFTGESRKLGQTFWSHADADPVRE